MLSLKAFLLLSVSCLASLAAASPVELAQMETRATTTICAVSGIKKGTDGTHQGDACTVSWNNPSYPALFKLDTGTLQNSRKC